MSMITTSGRSRATRAVRVHARDIDVFGPVTGLAVAALWAAAAVLAALVVLRRRDA